MLLAACRLALACGGALAWRVAVQGMGAGVSRAGELA